MFHGKFTANTIDRLRLIRSGFTYANLHIRLRQAPKKNRNSYCVKSAAVTRSWPPQHNIFLRLNFQVPGDVMQRLRQFLLSLLVVIAAALATGPFAQAQTSGQSWPQRPVRFIIPLGPGSGVDITARLLGDKLSAKWGQPVVIENRPGGDSLVAINAFTGADGTSSMTPRLALTASTWDGLLTSVRIRRSVLSPFPLAACSRVVKRCGGSATRESSNAGCRRRRPDVSTPEFEAHSSIQ